MEGEEEKGKEKREGNVLQFFLNIYFIFFIFFIYLLIFYNASIIFLPSFSRLSLPERNTLIKKLLSHTPTYLHTPNHPLPPSPGNEDTCIVERLFSSSLVAVVSLSSPRKLKVCHFKKNSEICNYSYPNTILGVKLNRAVSVCVCVCVCVCLVKL